MKDNWVRVAVGFPDHPKVTRLSDAAFRGHMEGICYSGRYLTDGHVPKSLVKNTVAFELVVAGLWIEHDNGYEIHDYLEWNESRAKVMAKREKRAAAGKKGADARWAKR